MEILGIDISVIIIALITAYIGFLFNSRSKKRENFIKELRNSYIEVYSPMFESLSEIKKTENKEIRLSLIDRFFESYSGSDTKIRYIASSFLLEYFYELRNSYELYKKESSRKNEKDLMEKLNAFYIMIEDEYWNAHDIIYEDHLHFRDTAFLNPFIVVLLVLFRILYHLSTFIVWASLIVLYFSIWNELFRLEVIPEWWSVTYALLFLTISLMFFGVMLMFKQFAVKNNRRKNKLMKKMEKKIKKLLRS